MGVESEGGGNEVLASARLDTGPEEPRVPQVHAVEVPNRDRAALLVAGPINQRFDAKLQPKGFTSSWSGLGRAKETGGPP